MQSRIGLPIRLRSLAWTLSVVAITALPAFAQQDLRLGEICRVKGQESVTLQGIGIVIGLRGTGDGKSPLTLRKLARILEMTGNPVNKDTKGVYLPEELQDTKNVALVAVSATIPPHGARDGDHLDCVVSAIAAKSLEGGFLFKMALQGPPGDSRVYALAQGPISLSDPTQPTFARVEDGCQLLETFTNPFLKDDVLTLVLKQEFAGFQAAHDVASTINQYNDPNFFKSVGNGIAKAIDGTTIEIQVPEEYRPSPVQFVSEILDQRIILKNKNARVIVDERTGTVVATKDARIGPVVVTHSNLTVEIGQQLVADFVAVDSEPTDTSSSVDGLVNALKALKVPPKDVITILRAIKETGSLYASLEEK